MAKNSLEKTRFGKIRVWKNRFWKAIFWKAIFGKIIFWKTMFRKTILSVSCYFWPSVIFGQTLFMAIRYYGHMKQISYGHTKVVSHGQHGLLQGPHGKQPDGCRKQ